MTQQSVWIVYDNHDLEGLEVRGVYSSEEKAKQRAAAVTAEWLSPGSGFTSWTPVIKEHKLDEAAS